MWTNGALAELLSRLLLLSLFLNRRGKIFDSSGGFGTAQERENNARAPYQTHNTNPNLARIWIELYYINVYVSTHLRVNYGRCSPTDKKRTQ
jgi:hypothetical protein